MGISSCFGSPLLNDVIGLSVALIVSGEFNKHEGSDNMNMGFFDICRHGLCSTIMASRTRFGSMRTSLPK